jgi:hypothetical protein
MEKPLFSTACGYLQKPLEQSLGFHVATLLAFDGAEEWIRRLNASQGIFKTASESLFIVKPTPV